ncbi:MAG: YfhO family protein [Anaerolineae bacterium]|nr:YfhO family protein [Anaerolineae bacterium]
MNEQRRSRRQIPPTLLLVGLLVIALLVFFPYLFRADRLMGPRSGLGTDISYRHWPDLTAYARVLREDGVIPLWDDAVAGGRPLAGDPGVLWLYPFDLLFLVLPPATAFSWLAMLHAVIGGVGNYLFLRRGVGLSRPAAFLGGAALMLSPKFFAHLAGGHVGVISGAAWIPWALLGVHLAVAGDWKGALLAGFALAIQLPTHIQIAFFTAWLAVVYALWRLLSPGWAGLCELFRRRSRRMLVVAGILPCFVAFSAAILFPLIGLLPYTSRQGFSLQDASVYSLPPVLLFTLLSPARLQFWEWVLYPGAAVLVLSFTAFLGPARRASIFWGAVALFSLLYALGPATPLFPLLHLLPGFAQLRVPPRIWFIGGHALTVLAALGVEAAVSGVAAQRLRRRQRMVRLLALLVYGGEAAAVVALVIFGDPPWQLFATLVVSIATLGLLFLYRRGKLRSELLQLGLSFLVLVELVPLARSYTRAIPVDELLAETPALAFLRQQPGRWRVYSTHGELPYALAAAAGIDAAEGLLALQVVHYVELVKLASGCQVEGYGTGVPPCLTTEVDPTAYRRAHPDPALLGLLNVRYVLTSLVHDDPDLELVADWGTERLYANRRFLPRAFVVFQTQVVPDQAAVLAALPQVDPAQIALLTEPLDISLEGSRPLVPAMVEEHSANDLTVYVDIPCPGLLVVSQTWMPGWRAWIDGQPARVHRVDYALQGVALPAGRHAVSFRYCPVEWQWGWRISLGGFAIAGIWVLGWLFSRLKSRVSL